MLECGNSAASISVGVAGGWVWGGREEGMPDMIKLVIVVVSVDRLAQEIPGCDCTLPKTADS